MSLEYKKLKMELARVQAARLEMEFIIAQRMEEVDRLNDNVKIQVSKEQELITKLKEMGE